MSEQKWLLSPEQIGLVVVPDSDPWSQEAKMRAVARAQLAHCEPLIRTEGIQEGRRQVLARLKALNDNHDCARDFDKGVQELITELEGEMKLKEQITKELEAHFNDPIDDPCPYCKAAEVILTLIRAEVEKVKWPTYEDSVRRVGVRPKDITYANGCFEACQAILKALE